MTLKYIKPLSPLFFLAMAGCSILAKQQSSYTDCFRQTNDVVNIDLKLLSIKGKKFISSEWDSECEKAKVARKKTGFSAKTMSQLLVDSLRYGSPERRAELIDNVLAELKRKNPSVEKNLSDLGITPEQLLIKKIENLVQDVVKTPKSPQAQDARGDLIALHAGTEYPLYAEQSARIVTHVLRENGLTLERITDEYLGKEPEQKKGADCQWKGVNIHCVESHNDQFMFGQPDLFLKLSV